MGEMPPDPPSLHANVHTRVQVLGKPDQCNFASLPQKYQLDMLAFEKKFTLPLKPTKPRVIVLRKMGMSVAQLATAFRQSILYVLRARLSLFHI